MKTLYQDEGYESYNEETLGDLSDKEGFAVLLGAADDTITLPTDAATAAACIGVVAGRYNDNNKEIQVALFNKEGSFRGVAGGVIAKGALVAVGTDARFVTTADRSLAVGRYTGNSATVAGDIIKIQPS